MNDNIVDRCTRLIRVICKQTAVALEMNLVFTSSTKHPRISYCLDAEDANSNRGPVTIMATLTLDLPTARESMADTLPSANFGFEELRERMTKFTLRFDAFIEKERKRVLDERNQFRKAAAEVQGNLAKLF